MSTGPAARYHLSTDRERLQLAWVTRALAATYWARGRTRETVEAAVAGSRCYGLYDTSTGAQVAFARVVTDGITFAWLCDVVVDENLRGRGLGQLLVHGIVDDPALATVTLHLATQDAHGLYEKFGFAREESLRRPRRRPLPGEAPPPASGAPTGPGPTDKPAVGPV